ncbi:TPA: hypothetical protein ACGUTA_004462 [Vibrio vulnificus]
MAKRIKRQASGCMELIYEWEESSSTHAEDEYVTKLKGVGDKVVLVETEKHEVTFKPKSTSKVEYEISVATLIKLIKENSSKP